MFKLYVKATETPKAEAETLVVFAWREDGASVWSDGAKKADAALKGMLSASAKRTKFTGDAGQTVMFETHEKIPAHSVVLCGLGDMASLCMEHWQTSVAKAIRARDVHGDSVALSLPDEVMVKLDAKDAARGAVIATALATYAFTRHQGEKAATKARRIAAFTVLVHGMQVAAVEIGVTAGELAASAVILARDLVNEPPSVTTPRYLADLAKDIAAKSKTVSCRVFDEKAMKKLGMGALLGIARGSSEPARFIELTYDAHAKETVVIVGKGITFDTGGLSLKPSEHMETMKMDMAGAADILAVFSVITALKPKVNVVGLVAATENMPGGAAIKPGDVVRAMSGKTIEVINTDAEGRVILADAMAYAGKTIKKPKAIIDLATLTGACVVALGEEVAGYFANDAQLGRSVAVAAGKAGERIWELPLVESYAPMIESKVADVRNIAGTRYGGAITAALFIREFVPEGVPWVHMDIAGPAFAERDTPLTPVGGTGFGVLTLLQYLS